MKLFEEVQESFFHYIPRNDLFVNLELALQHAKENSGGMVISQIAIDPNFEADYRITGAWVPPEIAAKLIAVIDEWRKSRGIPRKSA